MTSTQNPSGSPQPGPHPEAQSAVQPGTQAEFGIWGPSAHQTEHVPTRAPKTKQPWGGLFTLWGFLGILAAQLLTLPIFIGMVMAGDASIDFESPTLEDDIISAFTDVVLSGPGLVVALVSQWAVFLGIPWLATRLKGAKSMAKDLGLRFKVSDIGVGLALAVAMQASLIGLGFLATAIGIDTDAADNTGIVTEQVGLTLVIIIFATAVMAPLTEEVFFRGMVLRSLLRSWAKVDLADPHPISEGHFGPDKASARRRKIGTVLAVLMSAVFFGVLHTPFSDGTNEVPLASSLFLIFQTGFLGAIFAVIALRTRRIGLPIVAHLWFNSSSVAMVMLFT